MIGWSELQAWLGETGDTNKALIEGLEVRAVAFLEEETGRYFGEPEETVEYVSGSGTRELWLSEVPDTDEDITVEEEDVTSDDSVEWDDIASTKYAVRNGRLIHNSSWNCGNENYRVTYTRGYAVGEEPETIRQAVLDLVKYKFDGRGRDERLQSETISGYSYTIADAESALTPAGWQDIAQRWRWMHV